VEPYQRPKAEDSSGGSFSVGVGTDRLEKPQPGVEAMVGVGVGLAVACTELVEVAVAVGVATSSVEGLTETWRVQATGSDSNRRIPIKANSFFMTTGPLGSLTAFPKVYHKKTNIHREGAKNAKNDISWV
jgi:hypothetical protein